MYPKEYARSKYRRSRRFQKLAQDTRKQKKLKCIGYVAREETQVNGVAGICYEKLYAFSKLGDPDRLTLELVGSSEHLAKFLNDTNMEEDWVCRLLQIFATCSDSCLERCMLLIQEILRDSIFLQDYVPNQMLSWGACTSKKQICFVKNLIKIITLNSRNYSCSLNNMLIDALLKFVTKPEENEELEKEIKALKNKVGEMFCESLINIKTDEEIKIHSVEEEIQKIKHRIYMLESIEVSGFKILPALLVKNGLRQHRISFENVEVKNLFYNLLPGHAVRLSKDNFNMVSFATVADQLTNVGSNDILLKAVNYPSKPKYLTDKGTKYHLHIVLQTPKSKKGASKGIATKSCSVKILENDSWPEYSRTCLDQYQLNAVKQALTKEFVNVRGFLGDKKIQVSLHIMDALVRNKSFWQKDRVVPMLIICYNNNVSDQFVQGLIEFGHKNIMVTDGTVTENSEKFSLNYITEKWMSSPKSEYWRNAIHASLKVKEAKKGQMKYWLKRLNALHKNLVDGKLLTFKTLETVMLSRHSIFFRKFKDACNRLALPVLNTFLALDRKQEHEIENYLEGIEMMTREECDKVIDPFKLKLKDKWRLYRYWAYLFTLRYATCVNEKAKDYEDASERIHEIYSILQELVFQQADIIMMTNACVEKYRRILNKMKPKIILVQDVAEELETHTIGCLPEGVEHLIMTD